ncbi:T9SS type A sorting domain-containing protein [Chryseobacterium sp.]|uniref:T9SS type A sorting domain-containing protein n=1 Tax=Chryseobacterium sp. TaxID=1871047 RepID=UPI00388E0B79
MGGSVTSFFSKNSDSFYLAGVTANHNGFSTEGALQPAIIPIAGPSSSDYTFFIAKFTSANLSTSESTKADQIKLFNNPNNGNFYITGDVLSTANYEIHLFDISGKLIYKEDLHKGKIHQFLLENLLVSGAYVLNLSSGTGEALKTFKLIVKK